MTVTVASVKTNQELPGFERPSIKALDAVIAPYLADKVTHAEATSKLKGSKTAVELVMNEHRGDLTENSDGDRCYMYSDGKKSFVAMLEHGEEKLSVRPVKSDEPEGDIG